MTNRFYLFALLIGAVVSGCGGNQQKTVTTAPTPKKPDLMPPFRFHKLIEVSPGQSYDIMSW